MPREKIIIGLDVGSCNVRVAVGQIKDGNSSPQILGVGKAVATGMRKGVVADIDETVKNIKEAAQAAERISGVSVDHAFVSISGGHIGCRASKGVVAVSRADGEISEEDKARAIKAAEAISLPSNHQILHVLPRRFTVDSQEAIKDPVGMRGVRLEVDALIVEGLSPYIKNLVKCIREAGLYDDGLLLGPLAAGYAALNKRQKELGVLLLDLGGGTTGMTVYEEGDILHCQILPVGSAHITNDIAIGLRISVDAAEKIKIQYGSAAPQNIGKREIIDLSKFDDVQEQVSRLQVAEIIEARAGEIFDLVNKELKKIDRAGLLPAGAVLVGGGAKLTGLVDLAKEKLKLPVQVGYPQGVEGVVDEITDASFTTVCGLILSALTEEMTRETNSGRFGELPSISPAINKVKKWLKGFLP